MKRAWTQQYFDHLIKGEDEAMFVLKEQYFPRSFFKYKGVNEMTISNLETNTIWLAEINSLNDPFECSIQFDNDECLRVYYADKKFQRSFKKMFGVELSKKETSAIVKSAKPYLEYCRICKAKNIIIAKSSEQQLQDVQSRFSEILEETNQNIKVTCFTEHHDSLLMWAHYADQHKGICIEYDFIEEDHIRPFLQPIIYSDKINKIGLFEELDLLRKIGSTLIKSIDWSYEDEWRLTIFKQKEDMPLNVPVPDPKAVYLGTRFEQNKEDDKRRFLALMKQKGVPVCKMVKHPNEYKLISIGI
ncbi:DUF2971 domain-containing protein [Pedobacter gandavensis]|uniref:DUF2971 domain-containing protein n=1 Tax=Pedobacter gandavensis TaxID=2679963 RepID=UPI00247A1327|nr:DUF2971 domain-containing protein [Pedobacter gandavensis]WGQ08944.1 DUF2971 domain-containing protein [Pedobacter gandavensis]